MRENAIKPAFLLSFGCIYEKSCLISCGLGAAARVLGHNGPKVLLLEIILTKSSKGPKSYRLSVYCFSHFFYKFKIDSETSHVQLVMSVVACCGPGLKSCIMASDSQLQLCCKMN